MSGDVFAEGRVHARLITFAAAPALAFEPLDHIRVDPQCQAPLDRPKEPAALSAGPVRDLRDFAGVDRLLRHRGQRLDLGLLPWRQLRIPAHIVRSEEHTSELQSLMRISY